MNSAKKGPALVAAITVTGGTGSVGRHLVQRMLDDGLGPLRVISRTGVKVWPGQVENAVEMVATDLADASSVPIVANSKVLIHLAYSRESFEDNTQMAANIVEAARQGSIERVIHCSTAVVGGFLQSGLVDESTPLHPSRGYQQNKAIVEEILMTRLPRQVELVVLRPSMIMGPGLGGLDFAVNRIVRRTLSSYLAYWALRNRKTNLLAVGNLVEAILFFQGLPAWRGREIYLVSDDLDLDNTYGRVDRLIREDLGKRPVWPDVGLPLNVLRLVFRLLRFHSPPDIVYSSAKLKKMGFRGGVELRDAIHMELDARLMTRA